MEFSFTDSYPFRIYFVLGSKEITGNKTHKISVFMGLTFYQTYAITAIELSSTHQLRIPTQSQFSLGDVFREPMCA